MHINNLIVLILLLILLIQRTGTNTLKEYAPCIFHIWSIYIAPVEQGIATPYVMILVDAMMVNTTSTPSKDIRSNRTLTLTAILRICPEESIAVQNNDAIAALAILRQLN